MRAVTSCRSVVSGSLSLPSPGFFSPFPHGTAPLSVAVSYLALDRGRPGFKQGFSCPALLRYRTMESDPFRLRGFHAVSRAFPDASAKNRFFPNSTGHPRAALQHPSKGFRLLRVRSPLLAQSLLISLPALLRWFTSRSLAPPQYLLPARGVCLATYGLPHSAICGSPDVCSSPQLFAAYRGLLRRTAPRHPPQTYTCLTIFSFPRFKLPPLMRSNLLPFPIFSKSMGLFKNFSF